MLKPRRLPVFLALISFIALVSCHRTHLDRSPNKADLAQSDQLSAMWSAYKYRLIQDGRVVMLDQGGISTSEGQGYALLRAVWERDRPTFERVWHWTQSHLQHRDDKLFAWKWKKQVLDRNSATDADTDIALALLLAARRFETPAYRLVAREILKSIWEREVLKIKGRYYLTAGNWSVSEPFPTIHVAYLAPYAYGVFAGEDSSHPWKLLIESSYAILDDLYFQKKLELPPEIVYLDPRTGQIVLEAGERRKRSDFSYDAFPLFWRMALDRDWFHRRHEPLRRQMLHFFEKEWAAQKKFFDRYALDGRALSHFEGQALYATIHSLALGTNSTLAAEIETSKLAKLRELSLLTQAPYYLQNWAWFDLAFQSGHLLRYDEFLGFLRPFDYEGFSDHFPWIVFWAMLLLFPLAGWHRAFKLGFLTLAFGFCLRYLSWRLSHSLNFLEVPGPFISLALWGAEFYSFSTVALLLLQLGLRSRKPSASPPTAPGFEPSVDIFIPIYSESLEILEKTLLAALAIPYANKKVYVCDDSHRSEVTDLAEKLGAVYVKGPKRHAKAGNLNNALTKSDGELVVVFDTDHIPVRSFLSETVPYFADAKVGFLQTPHHFYNPDIFQRAFGTERSVPNEQDMFNHAIQAGRSSWNGAFFVGSGAVFRRTALQGINGFNLMSITEDIHTSQHLHAAGWRSIFVDKDLAAGLTAENISSYIVQRRRWMLGCLQIFFKDNPLFCRGLGLRQRLGYFASLYYFFFPLTRIVFWATPLFFLLFHWHPMLADVSVLLAYLLPFALALPLINSVLLPGWPRAGWGGVYEMAGVFVLARSIFDLFLPKNLGFKVTPKGIVSQKRAFDFESSKLTLFALALTAIAIGKGLVEFYYFGIEKDAYFFNLIWAGYNLLFLGIALLVAWERPQQRAQDRLLKRVPLGIKGDEFYHTVETYDLSLSGLSFFTTGHYDIPKEVTLSLGGSLNLNLDSTLIYNEKVGSKRFRCGLRFTTLTDEQRQRLLLGLFATSEAWVGAHDHRSVWGLPTFLSLLGGLLRCFRRLRPRRRLVHRQPIAMPFTLKWPDRKTAVLLRDRSARGVGLYHFGAEPITEALWPLAGILEGGGSGRCVHQKRVLPRLWRVGLERVPSPPVQKEITESHVG